MEGSGINNQYWVANQVSPINLFSLLKKMLSYKLLMFVSLFLGLIISLVWGVFIYQPTYDLSVSYSLSVTANSALSDNYGVKYLSLDNLVSMIRHSNMLSRFMAEEGINGSEIDVDIFLKPLSLKTDNNILMVSVGQIKEKDAPYYKAYISYCIDSFNEENRKSIEQQLQAAKSYILEELQVLQNNAFDNENMNSTNYSYIITLNDRIKAIDVQIADIENGVARLFSDYEETKVSSRIKPMIIIVLGVLFFGAFAVFIICINDPRIYFSDDINDIPLLRGKLLACIPLYKHDGISEKEFLSIASKLPDNVSSVSISEISAHVIGIAFIEGFKSISNCNTNYVGSLIDDANVVSDFTKYDVNLIVVRAGIDTINQVRNIVRDCRIKGVDNYYFILYGLELSDKDITQFEDSARYIKYPFLSLRTWKQHYSKYYNSSNNRILVKDFKKGQ